MTPFYYSTPIILLISLTYYYYNNKFENRVTKSTRKREKIREINEYYIDKNEISNT